MPPHVSDFSGVKPRLNPRPCGRVVVEFFGVRAPDSNRRRGAGRGEFSEFGFIAWEFELPPDLVNQGFASAMFGIIHGMEFGNR
jgi:hypothetical protein